MVGISFAIQLQRRQCRTYGSIHYPDAQAGCGAAFSPDKAATAYGFLGAPLAPFTIALHIHCKTGDPLSEREKFAEPDDAESGGFDELENQLRMVRISSAPP